MLSSIHPLGERGRGHRFGVTAAAFVVGSLVGGAATGVVVGTLGGALRAAVEAATPMSLGSTTSLLVVSVVGIVALVFDLGGRALPSVQRQVNEDWLVEFRGWVYGFGFGAQLGAGVATYITSAAILVWLAAMLTSGSIAASVSIGAVFGLARGLSIVPARRIDQPGRLVDFHRDLHRSAPRVARVGTVSLGLVTVIAAVLAAA